MNITLCTSSICLPVVYRIIDKYTAMSNEEGSSGESSNVTDPDVPDLSHLDAPNESLYMISGVCVAMLLVGVIIILLAVTISKLRKREEHSNSVHPVPDATTTVVLQTTAVPTAVTTNGSAPVATGQPQKSENNDPLAYRGQFLWAFPPPPAERMLYNNEQKNIVQTTNNDRSGFVRGFRKNLGGRWRRLVKKKPPTDIYTIPAELKPQLKQIYVY